MREKLIHIISHWSIKALFALLSLFIALYLFGLIADEIFLDNEEEFDQAVFHYLADDLTPGLLSIMRFFTLFGKPEFLIPAYLILIVFFFIKKKKNYAIEIAIMGASSTLLLFGLKKIFQRKRPDIPILEHLPGYSFPSGHALLSFVFCSVLIYLIWDSNFKVLWKWSFGILLVLFSIVIGISRIVLRAHYASDVIAGFCLGYAWVIFALWVQHRYLTKKKLQDQGILGKQPSAG